MYCTYLTIYRGGKMPPFYIGSSSIDNVINKKYHGSVESIKYGKIWRQELKDNPHLFESKIITKHNDRQEATLREYKFQKSLDVIHNDLYINQAVAAKNGFFGRNVEGELNPSYGKPRNPESNAKQSKSMMGKPSWNKGISPKENTRIKMINTKIERGSNRGANNHAYGKIGITNGVINKFVESTNIPEGWRKGIIRTNKS